jgi:hypothetical protein
MQSPTPRSCQYCDKRPADQTLFTTFMRCSEGDATKRNAHLCERCRHHAMLVLDRIGMTVAFENDGQLHWDAHVTLSEHATRSLARRRVQREDLLLQLAEPSADGRTGEPTAPERSSILHQLATEGLIESTVDRGGEFWPEDPCRLTGEGEQAASAIRDRRLIETDGRPISEWSPLYTPEGLTREEYQEQAEQHAISPEGDWYDATTYMMLRRDDGEPPGMRDMQHEPHVLFDPQMWTTRRVKPVGYYFHEKLPAIAFDADGVQVFAEYYELIRTVGGPGVRWTVMEPTPANPEHANGRSARTVRADDGAGKAVGFAAIFEPPGRRPVIETLREHARR